MRHLKKNVKLGRTKEHRDAMLSNMMASLFAYERIRTTTAKAKALRSVSEKVITRAKQNTLHNKRVVLKKMKDRDMVAKLFDDIAPRYEGVHGGYTRIVKLGRRYGDGAEMALLELVETEPKKSKSGGNAHKTGKKTEKKPEKE
jgi:large subunit ribosomal protein L17